VGLILDTAEQMTQKVGAASVVKGVGA
jgi:hypothetical protein